MAAANFVDRNLPPSMEGPLSDKSLTTAHVEYHTDQSREFYF